MLGRQGRQADVGLLCSRTIRARDQRTRRGDCAARSRLLAFREQRRPSRNPPRSDTPGRDLNRRNRAMARVKRGTKRRARRKKLLKHAKGFFLTKSKLFRSAKEAVNRSLRYSYRDRRNAQARLPHAVDSAHRRGRPEQRHHLQPVDSRAEAGRHRYRPQDSRGHGRARRGRIFARWSPRPSSIWRRRLRRQHSPQPSATDISPRRGTACRARFR